MSRVQHVHSTYVYKDAYSTFACLINDRYTTDMYAVYVYISYYIYRRHSWTIVHYVCRGDFVALNLICNGHWAGMGKGGGTNKETFTPA